MNLNEISVFYQPQDRLRLTVEDDRSYLAVKPVWSAPLSHPNRYLALLDGKESEITLVVEPQKLPEASWQALQQELYRRYLTAQVKSIISARQEFGATYWNVETDRGSRDFVTQSLQENAQWFSETHLLLTDVDGNRFEIDDTVSLDERSRAILFDIV